MQFSTDFKALLLDGVHDEAQRRHDDGWRYVQMLAVNKDESADVIYSFMKDGMLENLVVSDVPRDAHIPSITDLYLEAFVCENEICDLFGINFDGIAIDFHGNFYKLATDKPMTIISPEQLAEREKQKKIAAAKAAKAAKEAKAEGEGATTSSSTDSADAEKALEAKLASMDPEKAAKVRAAMKAKSAKAAKASDAAEAKTGDSSKTGEEN